MQLRGKPFEAGDDDGPPHGRPEPRLQRLEKDRFRREALGARVGPFTDAVQAGAEAAFYGERAILTARFVRRPQFGG